MYATLPKETIVDAIFDALDQSNRANEPSLRVAELLAEEIGEQFNHLAQLRNEQILDYAINACNRRGSLITVPNTVGDVIRVDSAVLYEQIGRAFIDFMTTIAPPSDPEPLLYSVVEQADKTFAVMCNGGYVRRYPTEIAALHEARELAGQAESIGVAAGVEEDV